jgi:hypothetical protein
MHEIKTLEQVPLRRSALNSGVEHQALQLFGEGVVQLLVGVFIQSGLRSASPNTPFSRGVSNDGRQ